MMVLGFTGGALGGHLAGWRHPDSFPTTSMQLQCMVEMAQIAERGGLDMMFLADGNGVRQMDKPAFRGQQPVRPPRGVRAGDCSPPCRSTPNASVACHRHHDRESPSRSPASSPRWIN